MMSAYIFMNRENKNKVIKQLQICIKTRENEI